MGAIMEHEKCSKCGGVMLVDYYYKSDEEYRTCHRCGTEYTRELLRDENENVILDENRYLQYKVNSHEGYGVYKLVNKKGAGELGTFHEPIRPETIAEFERILEDPAIDVKNSFLASWENGEQKLLVGSHIPDINRLSFEEWKEGIEPKTKDTAKSSESEDHLKSEIEKE